MYSVLIMGGSDYIGSSLAKYLIKNKYEVDIMTRGRKDIEYKGIKNHLICDRKNLDEMKIILDDKKYDYVYDINARSKEDIEVLCESLDKEYLKKYILVSPQDDIFIENQKVIDEFVKSTTLPYIITKSSNVYGDNSKKTKEEYLFYKIEKSIPIEIPKDNNLRAQFIYIDDFVKVLCSLAKHGKTREIYNITNPQIISIDEYINVCSEVVGKKANVRYTDSSIADLNIRKKFEKNHLDIDKIIQDGLYIPNILLNSGVESLYDWYNDVYNKKIKIKQKLGKVLKIG